MKPKKSKVELRARRPGPIPLLGKGGRHQDRSSLDRQEVKAQLRNPGINGRVLFCRAHLLIAMGNIG